ncbi:MAG: TraB/GumN family protein, partial [Nanoarchaeota archaeon]|nr:TraB/GumN family protein [Nanoarchaeota archaeon]
EKGAKIEETESKELLLKEYDYVKEFTSAENEKKDVALKEYEKAKDELIKKRDEFIAKRIDETLKEDETGFLFIGAHHKVKDKLAKGIEIKELD